MTFDQFKYDLDRHITQDFSAVLQKSTAEEEAVLATHLNPNSEELYDLSVNREIRLAIRGFQHLGKRDCLLLAILSWWLPPFTRVELQESLRDRFYKQQYFEMYSYIHSKELCLYKIYLEDDYSLSDLYGNILKLKKKVSFKDSSGNRKTVIRERKLNVFIQLRERAIPCKKVFKRGYNDHGSRPSISEVARKKALRENDTYLEELKIEQERLSRRLRIENNILLDQYRLETREGIK